MKKKGEDGSIIVEATIYFPIIIMVVGLIIIISLIKLQQCMTYAVLSSSASITSIDAMEGYDAEHDLDDVNNFISSLSIIKGKSKIDKIKVEGTLVNNIRLNMSYTFDQPMFYKVLFKGSYLQYRQKPRDYYEDITALTIDPRYTVDTIDQYILFNCSGSTYGNLMQGKYLTSYWQYIYKQYQ